MDSDHTEPSLEDTSADSGTGSIDEEVRKHYSGVFDPDLFATDFIDKIVSKHRSVRDISFLNTLYLSKGGDIPAIIEENSLSIEAIQVIKHLKEIYEIKTTSSNVKDVTLERLHLAFPVVGCRIAALISSTNGPQSYSERFKTILGCPAFSRYCPTLVAFGGGEGQLYMDAHRWARYSYAKCTARGSFDKKKVIENIQKESTAWAVEKLDNVSEALENKLDLFKTLEDIVDKQDPVNEMEAVKAVSDFLKNMTIETSKLEELASRAMNEETEPLECKLEITNSPLTINAILEYSGALLNYLIELRRRLQSESDCDESSMRSFLLEAAETLVRSKPDEILEFMERVGIKKTWSEITGIAHMVMVGFLLKHENLEFSSEKKDLIRYGLSQNLRQSVLFNGCYPVAIHVWAGSWQKVSSEPQ